MEQEKFGKLIKDIRNSNNLTQKEFALKYHVTYQAVSKWENGKNMPDISLIKKIAKDFNISMDDMFEIKKKKNKGKKTMLFLSFLLFAFFLLLIIPKSNNHGEFNFKILTTTCEDFNITGSLAYNHNKTSIYLSNIEYCGGNDEVSYNKIECTLYEKYGDTEKKISSCSYDGEKETTLEEYLKNVTLTSENYSQTCKEYTENSLYLEINASEGNRVTTYKIPLRLNDDCKE